MGQTDPLCPSAPWPVDLPPFHPRRWLENGHAQTIAGNVLPRPKTLPPPTPQLVEVVPARGQQMASQVLCECHWQPAAVRRHRPTVILLHGLEGSSRSQYVIGNSSKFFNAGCNIIRMNMRTCGGTERLSPTLYHSGMSADVGAVMEFFLKHEELETVALIGYSMGGNLVLKLAGELGRHAPPQLRAVVGVSAAVDLGESATALGEPSNRFYERRFVRALLKRFRRKAFLFPRAFDVRLAENIVSIREFDHRITALYGGFQSADDYYDRCSAARVLGEIRVPTLLMHACDDPFVRLSAATRATVAKNRAITLLETRHGGHCAFLAQPEPANGNDGYWAEHTALRFMLAHANIGVAVP